MCFLIDINFMSIHLILTKIILLFIAYSNRQTENGKIEYAYMVHNQYSGDPINKTSVFTTKNEYWKSGNNIIETIAKIVVNQNDSTTQTKIVVDKFVFFDFDKKIVREYGSLSDTAAVKKEYSFNDTTIRRSGWDFRKRFNIKYDSKTRLTDTVLNNTLYKRERCRTRYGTNELVFDVFFDCSKARSVFEFSKNLSDEMGCPHVKTVTYFSGNLKNVFYESEIVFTESASESTMRKIFKAWSK